MKKYQEILKLKKMLEKANIPFVFTTKFDGYQIRLNDECDAVEFNGTYGAEDDLIEIMGALTSYESFNDDVCGHLTAKEVFTRWKYCYENSTAIYEA